MLRSVFATIFLALGAASAASAETYACQGPGLSLTVDIDAPTGRCAVDGRRADMKRAHDPVVCHVATPQLLILTIGSDGAFIWEDTSRDRVVRGTCNRA